MTTSRVSDLLAERKYLRRLLQLNAPGPVVLIGSYARKTSVSPGSDVDVLLLGEPPMDTPPSRIQLISMLTPRLKGRVAAGDDFAQWALRFGIPLTGRAAWAALRAELLPTAPWPNPSQSHARARKSLDAAQVLRDMGDLASAEEETMLALSHVARAALLGEHVFPLSRPELPDQVTALGDFELAGALRRAMHGDMSAEELTETIEVTKRRLPSRPDCVQPAESQRATCG